jgi:hypothetical protein
MPGILDFFKRDPIKEKQKKIEAKKHEYEIAIDVLSIAAKQLQDRQLVNNPIKPNSQSSIFTNNDLIKKCRILGIKIEAQHNEIEIIKRLTQKSDSMDQELRTSMGNKEFQEFDAQLNEQFADRIANIP